MNDIADGRICFKELGSYVRSYKIRTNIKWKRQGAWFRLHPKWYKCLSKDNYKLRVSAHIRMKKVR